MLMNILSKIYWTPNVSIVSVSFEKFSWHGAGSLEEDENCTKMIMYVRLEKNAIKHNECLICMRKTYSHLTDSMLVRASLNMAHA